MTDLKCPNGPGNGKLSGGIRFYLRVIMMECVRYIRWNDGQTGPIKTSLQDKGPSSGYFSRFIFDNIRSSFLKC